MSMSAKLRSLCTRLIRGVPDGYIRADAPKYRYVSADDLPDADRMIRAGLAEPWRVDRDGTEWFRVTCDAIAAVDDYDPDPDGFDDDFDLDGFDDDDFDHDDDDFDHRFPPTPYSWSGHPA